MAAITRKEELQEWLEMKRACASRPEGMSIEAWCKTIGISQATYYYYYRVKVLKECGLIRSRYDRRRTFEYERNLKYWSPIVQQCKLRPKYMTVEDWCIQQGISYHTFKYWRCRIRVVSEKSGQETVVGQRQEYMAEDEENVSQCSEDEQYSTKVSDLDEQYGTVVQEDMKDQNDAVEEKDVKSLQEDRERQQTDSIADVQDSKDGFSAEDILPTELNNMGVVARGLNVRVNGYSVHVTETTSMDLLSMVLSTLREI